LLDMSSVIDIEPVNKTGLLGVNVDLLKGN